MKSIISKDSVEKTVILKNGLEVVRSDKFAEMFKRTHKQVLSLIRSNLEFFKENNLSPKDYFIEDVTQTQKGKVYTRFFLTRKGFDFIALSLRGKEAQLYKIWYIDSFHEKQELIREHKLIAKLNNTDDLWVKFRDEGKEFRDKLTKAIHDTVVIYREKKESKMNDGKYYYHYTSLIYKILGISISKAVNPRDVLDKRMLVRLEDMENKIADMIVEYAGSGLHYKDVYKKIKEELLK